LEIFLKSRKDNSDLMVWYFLYRFKIKLWLLNQKSGFGWSMKNH